MTYHLFILGCQYNYHDAHSIAHLMNKMGYVYVDDEKQADVIIVLACSVRQKAVDRIFGKLKIWRTLPKKPKIIITACVLPKDRGKLIDKVDAIIEPDKFDKEIIQWLNYQPANKHLPKGQSFRLEFYPADAKPYTAYIPIMQGCDNFCSYCAVPYTRGREVSRQMKDIIYEVKKEVISGKKHIILLGQNVNSYGKNIKSNSQKLIANSFINLLKEIDKISGGFDYNFMSANPQDFSEELINFLSCAKKWNRKLHLPLQSGNDQILRKMNRKYDTKKYYNIIKNLKLKIKNLRLSTDLIVGFPSETQKQFQDTVNLCKKIGFDKAYVSQYSPRPSTPAAKMKDNISKLEKKRRWEILDNFINKRGVYS